MIWIITILLIINLFQFIIHFNYVKEQNLIERRMIDKIKVQSQDGAYNYDKYNLGLYNGMHLIYATYKRLNPVYVDPKEIKFMKD